MMSFKTPRTIFLLSLAALLTVVLPPQAHADTFELFSFSDYSGAAPILAIDDHGDVVTRSPCGDGTYNCYAVFQPFGPGAKSAQFPTLNYAGTAIFDPSGNTILTLYNKGYEVYYDYDPNSNFHAIYGGPESNLQEIAEGSGSIADFITIDDYGDIAWTDGSNEENYLAYDLTAHQTPEPTTGTLMLTGLTALATLFVFRRKPLRP